MKSKAVAVEAKIQKELFDGETLIWTGIPQQGLVLRKLDLIEIPASILICIVVLKLVASAWSVAGELKEFDPILIFLPLTMIPFLIVGLFMLIGRFVLDLLTRSNSCYGLTNRRVIIVSGMFRKTVSSLHVKNLLDISVTDLVFGRGTIQLSNEEGATGLLPGSVFNRPKRSYPRLERIENARDVYQKILDAQDAYFRI